MLNRLICLGLVFGLCACSSHVEGALEEENSAQHGGVPQTCETLLGSHFPVSDELQVTGDSDVLYADSIQLEDQGATISEDNQGRRINRARRIELLANVYANIDGFKQPIDSGLTMRLIARYCNGQTREAVSEQVDGPNSNLYMSEFDTTVPVTTPRQWQLTLSWNNHVVTYFIPAISDFEVSWKPASLSGGPAIIQWDGNAPQALLVSVGDITDSTDRSVETFSSIGSTANLKTDASSVEFASYEAGHGYVATVSKDWRSALPGTADAVMSLTTTRQSVPFYFLQPAPKP